MFHVVDEDLLDKSIDYLKGSKSYNIVRGTYSLFNHQNMKSKYPIIVNIIINLAITGGHLEKSEANLILAIVNHTKQVYISAITSSSKARGRCYTVYCLLSTVDVNC